MTKSVTNPEAFLLNENYLCLRWNKMSLEHPLPLLQIIGVLNDKPSIFTNK